LCVCFAYTFNCVSTQDVSFSPSVLLFLIQFFNFVFIFLIPF
jgi:hypothetical protein